MGAKRHTHSFNAMAFLAAEEGELQLGGRGGGGGGGCVCGLVFFSLTNNAAFNRQINTTNVTKVRRSAYKLLQEGH